MFEINVMKRGDEVLAINERFLAIKRKNGTVDIFNVMYNEANELLIDPVKVAVIGYGEGMVGKKLDEETTIYTF